MTKYKKYKASGVEWIEEIPEHWEIKKLKYSFQFQTGWTPPTGKLEYYEDGKNIWITISDIEGKFITDSKQKITNKAIIDSNMKLLPKGTLLYSFKLSLGKISFLGVEAYTNEAIIAILPSKQNNLNYFYYSLSDQLLVNANENIYGAKILNQDLMRNSNLLLPTSYEQTKIANFLDKKTEQIDDLITKKEKLIKLLEEEKTAVINEAVTKGIDPDAKLKDSGIEWLGKIPEHWKLKRWRYLFRIVKIIAGQIGLNILSITQKGIKIKNIKNNDGQLSSDYSKYQIVNKGDFAMNSMDLLTGFIDISNYEGVTSPDYKVFKLVDLNSVGKYYLYIFQMNYKKEVFYSLGRGAAMFGRWRLPTDELKQFLIPCPPKEEQTEIVKHIEKELTRIDKTIETTKKLIELLKEYRTSLISEAVTGKIKVIDGEEL